MSKCFRRQSYILIDAKLNLCLCVWQQNHSAAKQNKANLTSHVSQAPWLPIPQVQICTYAYDPGGSIDSTSQIKQLHMKEYKYRLANNKVM
jgi:hypothetical protein